VSETGLIAVACALAVFSAFMAVVNIRQGIRALEREAAGHEREKVLVTLVARAHRAFWTSPNTWIDPDCFECGGAGAPCCDPPTYPYRRELEGVPFGGDGWTSTNPRRPGDALWDALDAMTAQIPVIKPEDPTDPPF